MSALAANHLNSRAHARRGRGKEIALILLFKGLLEVLYVVFVYPNYAYSGFMLHLNAIKLLESYIFLIFLYIFLPSAESRISAIGTKLLFVVMVVPTLSLYALEDESRNFLYLCVIGFWLTLLTIRLLPKIQIRKIKGLTPILSFSLVIASLGVLVILIKLNGLPTLKALKLTTVYSIRSVVTWGGTFMGYLVPWVANVINPFFLGIAWYRKRWFSALAIFALQLVLFLITGMKSFLFSPFLVLFLLYAIQKRRVMRLSLVGLISGSIVAFLIYAVGWSIIPASLFIRRVLFAPAQISFYYYDFFSKHQLMYLAGSHLNPFLSSPYNMPIPHLIGEIYYNSPAMNVNTGYLADAYMNFGFLGILLFSMILGVVFVILDSIAAKTNITIAVGAMIVPIFSLVNGALFTVLGTSGLLLGMIIVWLYSRGANRSATLTAQSYLPPLASRSIE